MNKQKQIEEMAKDLKEEKLYALINKTSYMRSAENLYDKGYRKIPENAVVLTREAYNRLFTKARQSEIKTIDLESIVNARKKTVEKIFKELKVKLKGYIGLNYLDEICKEITEGSNER